MKNLYFILFLFLLHHAVYGQQQGQLLEGQVIDYLLQPFKNTKVSLKSVNGVHHTFTNSQGYFLLELPSNIHLDTTAVFVVNGEEIHSKDYAYSKKNNFVSIKKKNNNVNKIVDRMKMKQIFNVTVKNSSNRPAAYTEVQIDGTNYVTNGNGKFSFMVSTKDNNPQINILHSDSVIKAPVDIATLLKEHEEREKVLLSNMPQTVEGLLADLENTQVLLPKKMDLLKKQIDNLVTIDKNKYSNEEKRNYMERFKNIITDSKNQADMDIYIAHIDSISRMYDLSLSASSQKIVDIEKQKQQIEAEKKRIEQEKEEDARTFRNRILVFVLVLAIMVGLLYFLGRINRKINKQKAEIEAQSADLREANRTITETNQQLEKSQIEIGRQARNLEKANQEITSKNSILEEQKIALEQVIQELKGTQLQLVQAEKMASLGVLTAGVAHEIKNPINFVYAGIDNISMFLEDFSQVLDKYDELTQIPSEEIVDRLKEIEDFKDEIAYNELKREMFDMVGVIKNGAERTVEIVKSLQTFSRHDESEIKVVDMHENIDSTLVLLKSQMKNIQIIKNYDKVPAVECYPGQINQVIMNIISNACQAMENEKEGKLAISMSIVNPELPKSEQMLKLSFKDSGMGMSEEVKSRIFDPFFTTKELGKGTGLGLSITFGIIRKHNGKIEVESEVGKGTEMSLLLPFIHQKPEETEKK
ncbi:MAG: hypothetical protein EAZ97_08885 [Bacteroidetes bacterium]|nr:MAG: hypothetical protein EAZ97_08885 [Bacteroidota bacterium]